MHLGTLIGTIHIPCNPIYDKKVGNNNTYVGYLWEMGLRIEFDSNVASVVTSHILKKIRKKKTVKKVTKTYSIFHNERNDQYLRQL